MYKIHPAAQISSAGVATRSDGLNADDDDEDDVCRSGRFKPSWDVDNLRSTAASLIPSWGLSLPPIPRPNDSLSQAGTLSGGGSNNASGGR